MLKSVPQFSEYCPGQVAAFAGRLQAFRETFLKSGVMHYLPLRGSTSCVFCGRSMEVLPHLFWSYGCT